jgi:glycerol-3-phosphate O-acyltransferase/dihydroxyacetone phosphate acyltransferase
VAIHRFRSLRPLIVSLLPGQQKHLDRLKRMRNEISNELSDVVNEFGPKLYDDFDKVCLLKSLQVLSDFT